jgi:hypothetical protein
VKIDGYVEDDRNRGDPVPSKTERLTDPEEPEVPRPERGPGLA